AANLATPTLIADADGIVVFYNEAAEAVVGQTFAELGEVPLEDLTEIFALRTRETGPMPLERRPSWIALNERRATHERFWITSADGVDREIEATAFPLFAHADEFV